MCLRLLTALMAAFAVAEAYPRYVAIPLEDIRLTQPYYRPEANPRRLAVRPVVAKNRRLYEEFTPEEEDQVSFLDIQEIPVEDLDLRYAASEGGVVVAEPSNSYSQSSGGNDHVDYGAYTGDGGAFGWYTDHPVLLGYH